MMDTTAAGHRISAGATGHVVEAWGPDRLSCLEQALVGVVETFARVSERPAPHAIALTPVTGGRDALESLVGDVVDALDVLGVVPVRFHLAETQDGAIAGDMDVVGVAEVAMVGRAPTCVSHDGLWMGEDGGGWRCRLRLDVRAVEAR